jgi:hypothetical protein
MSPWLPYLNQRTRRPCDTGDQMATLRFYRIDRNGRIRRPPDILECAGDADALARAAERLTNDSDSSAIEIWDQARLLGVVSRPANAVADIGLSRLQTGPQSGECAA